MHTFLLLTFCMYIQKQITSSYRKRTWKINTSETKILIALCYYGIFGIVTLTYLTLGTINREEIIAAIEQYFVCEAAGSGMECDRSKFEQLTHSGLVITTFVLLGFFPYTNLIFVIKWRATKNFYRGILDRCCQNSSSSSSTKNQTVNGMDQIANATHQTVPTPVAPREQSA